MKCAEVVLYYSASRLDHFSSTNQCEGCDGLYKLVRTQGYVLTLGVGNDECVQRVGTEDFYFFGHGVGYNNYRQALKDFAAIAGPIPIPRRHMLGVSDSPFAPFLFVTVEVLSSSFGCLMLQHGGLKAFIWSVMVSTCGMSS